MHSYFITGTDTDVGKTVAASWLQLHLNGMYWKPVQSGIPKDIDTLKSLTRLPNHNFLPSRYELTQPLSPHEAARRDNISISLDDFILPETSKPLVVEGAGGLMVPLNEDSLIIDLIEHFNLPVILVCRSTLGTINHTLLSIEALHARDIKIKGLILSGEPTSHNRQALEEYGKLPIIAELPILNPLNKEALLSIKPEIEL